MIKKERFNIYDILSKEKKIVIKPKKGFMKMLNDFYPDIKFIEKDFPDKETYIELI